MGEEPAVVAWDERASTVPETAAGGHGWPACSTGHVGPAVTYPYTPDPEGAGGGAVEVVDVAAGGDVDVVDADGPVDGAGPVDGTGPVETPGAAAPPATVVGAGLAGAGTDPDGAAEGRVVELPPEGMVVPPDVTPARADAVPVLRRGPLPPHAAITAAVVATAAAAAVNLTFRVRANTGP